MNTAEQKAVEAKDVVPEFIMTKAGFMVVGHELVGEKMAALICEAVNSFDKSGLTAIVLRNDGYPKAGEESVFGVCHPDTNSVAVNIERCWDHACHVAMEDKKSLSFLGILWTSIISSIGHELDHLVIAESDRELYESMRKIEDGKDLEDSAKEAERQLICSLARDFDTELPAPAEMGWLGVKWMGLHTDEATKDLPWVVKAREMAEKGIIYSEPENEIEVLTYRQFVKQAYNQDSPAWDQPTNPISIAVYLGEDEVKVLPAEPVPAPKTDAVDVEKTIEEKTVQMVQQSNGMFIGAGVSVGDDDDDQPEELTAANLINDNTPVGSDAQVAAAATGTPVADNLSVPLAPVVAEEQAAFAAAAAMPETPPAETTYAPCNMDMGTAPAMMEMVWKTLYHHIFTKCGWSQNPQTGRFYFASPAAILEHVNIQHIITQFNADGFIAEYDTLNAQGQGPLPELCQGSIRGHFTKKDGLPTFTIFLNIGGQRHKRTIVPQNPEKLNAQNAYSNPALEAQKGHQIAWVFNGDMPFGSSFTDKTIAKITNTAAGINYELIS